VAIDGTEPFGYGRMLPAGLLREPVSALGRADAIVLTRCDQADKSSLDRLETKLRLIKPGVIIARAVHCPLCVKAVGGRIIGLERLKGMRVFAFCGIGNPMSFQDTIKTLGAEVVNFEVFNDHHHYKEQDVEGIYQRAVAGSAELILCTSKDWMNIRSILPVESDLPFAYLSVELEFLRGRDEIIRLIEGRWPVN